MNCRELEPKLTGYLAGELDEVTARAARGHLRICTGCRALAEDHAQVRAALEGLGGAARPEPPPAMWDAIQRELGQAEIADARAPRWARWWQRARPHLLPGSLALGACTAAELLIQLRHDHDRRGPDLRAAVMEHLPAPSVAPTAPDGDPPRPPIARPRPERDASAELADDSQRLEQRFRTAAAELLPMARAEVATWKPARARAFQVELARREGRAVRAAPGRDRDRAWHQLIALLETTTLGERVATIR